MAFYVVYILEAHASDLWQLPSNIRDKVVFASPRSIDERSALANSCVRKLGIEFPALIDDFGNATEIAYTAWPDRLYVIDKNGRVAYKSKPGPFGFKPSEVEAVLKKMLPPRLQDTKGYVTKTESTTVSARTHPIAAQSPSREETVSGSDSDLVATGGRIAPPGNRQPQPSGECACFAKLPRTFIPRAAQGQRANFGLRVPC